MTFEALQITAQAHHLNILGGFHPEPADGAPDACKTLLMVGPHEPAFWPMFTRSDEYNDGAADPLDRWSTRVITALATELGGTARFPFGGAPYDPFYTWALRTGRIHGSPVNFLVHDTVGLFVSFRGALCFSYKIILPPAPPNPCTTCAEQPCTRSCPVDALKTEGYDVAACKAYLDTRAGLDCVSNGCAVRRSCPVSQGFGRMPEQSAFHMRAFKGD